MTQKGTPCTPTRQTHGHGVFDLICYDIGYPLVLDISSKECEII